MKKFKDIRGWKSEKDGQLNREFFKWMGNLSLADHRKLAKHLLNRSGKKRVQAYPKVTMKKIRYVLENCYSVKDWIERRKRKQLVCKGLNIIDPKLGLFQSNGNFRPLKWKKFKEDYFITSATMQVLTEAAGDYFFSERKQISSKNKDIVEISPYAKAVLELFLKTKKNFQKPFGCACMRPYDVDSNTLGKWPSLRWEEGRDNLTLGIIDFRHVPGISSSAESSIKKPYFESFIGTLEKQSAPEMTDPPAWLWICGDKHATSQIVHYAQEKLISKYHVVYSNYAPCPNERLEDRSASHRASKVKISLVFLLKKGSGVADSGKKIPMEFCAPNDKLYQKAGKYSELEYRMSSIELRMEFYLRVLQIFCKPGDSMIMVLAGGKPICAGMMNSMCIYSIGYYGDAEEFKRVVALSRNLDMRDFAHDAYVVDEDEFPMKAKKSVTRNNRVKRKIVEIVESKDEADEEQTPLDPNPECAASSGNEGESDPVDPATTGDDDLHSHSHPPLDPIDDDVEYDGELQVLQRQRGERSSAGLHFFSLDVDNHRHGRRRHTSPPRPVGVTLEGNSSGSVIPCELALLEKPSDVEASCTTALEFEDQMRTFRDLVAIQR